MKAPNKWAKRFVSGLCFFCLSSCGYSQQEWDQQLRNANSLSQQVEEQKQLAATCSNDSSAARAELQQLRIALTQRGLRLDHLAEDLERQQLATREYDTRVAQLGNLQTQVIALQHALSPLKAQGVVVAVRDNRMAIRLPASLLFKANTSRLSATGISAIGELAAAVQQSQRRFQVAAHTDANQPIPRGAEDNLALSTQQATTVLKALSKALTTTGTSLANGWSAAGFGDADPIARNDTSLERLRNQRIELVALPLAEEMLDLSDMARLR